MKRCLFLASVVLSTALFIMPCALAGPPDFLPGDSYFSGLLFTRINPTVPVDNTLLVVYQQPIGNEGMMKFRYGTLRLKLTGVTPEKWELWNRAIDQLRQFENEALAILRNKGGDPAEEIVEVNPLYVFVYPDTFNLSEMRPFLRYNENWSEEATKLGVQREEQFLPSFYRDSHHREWRDAKSIPSLPVAFGSREGGKAESGTSGGFGGGRAANVQLSSYPDNREAASYPYEKSTVLLVADRTLRDLMNRDDPNLMPSAGEEIVLIRGTQLDTYVSTGKAWSKSDGLE
jgi:hypothetical protein